MNAMAAFRTQYKLKGRLVTLRSAEPEDAAEMIEMVRQMDRESDFLAREPGEFAMTVEEEAELIQTRKELPNFRFAVAVCEGKIVGISDAFYLTRRRYRHTGGVTVSILRPFWNRGIGRALLESGLTWLGEQGVERVELSVDTKNIRAIGLYHRLGFVVEGTMRRERKLADGSYRDTYRMALDLKRQQEIFPKIRNDVLTYRAAPREERKADT